MCKVCGGTGLVEVSLASAENGPTDDPRDEIGCEPCDCSIGYDLWYKECVQAEAEFDEYMDGRR